VAKKALIVGINYLGTPNRLHGCVNDANNVYKLLTAHFGFDPANVVMLLDSHATTTNILNELNNLVSNPQKGDILYFHYSGHGSQIPAVNGKHGGVNNIICPVDLDWETKMIADYQLKEIFDRVPHGVSATLFLDCCHSGTDLDQANIYQPHLSSTRIIRTELPNDRYIDPPQEMIDKMQGCVSQKVSIQSRDVNDSVLLIAGCRASETSADAFVDGTYQGAATCALNTLLIQSNFKMSYQTIIDQMAVFMAQNGYEQHPELDGSPVLFSTNYLESFQ